MTGKEFEKLTIKGVLPSLRGSRRGRGEVAKPSPGSYSPRRPTGLLWILRRLLSGARPSRRRD
jgi:hypothetical protein